jgi:O-antigen ligase
MKLISVNEKLLKFFFYLLPLSYCIGQAAVSFVFVIFVIFFFISNKKISFLYDDIIKRLLILYFFSLILGSFFSFNINQSLYSSVTLIRFFIFFLAIDFFADIFKKKIQNKFFLWSFLLAFIVILDAYYQYFNPLKEDIFGFKADAQNTGRLTSVFKNELIVGSTLYNLFYTSLIFLIFFIKKKLNSFLFFHKFLIIFSVLFYLIAVFLSGDRMPFIMTIATFFLTVILLKNFRYKLSIALIIFLFFFIFQISKNNYFSNRYAAFIGHIEIKEKNIEDNISQKKTFFDSQWGAHFLTGYEIFRNNVYFGIGLKQFKIECSNEIYENIDSDFRKGRCSSHPHNIYIEMISETGLFSSLILLITIFYFFVRCLKVIFNKKFKAYYNNFEYVIFISFFLVNVLTFFPLRSSGSFFSNFAGSLIWYNFSFLFIYLKHFENILKKN